MSEISQDELMKLQIKSFLNSPDPVTALKRFAQDLPVGVMRRLVWYYLNTVVSILAAMGKIIGLNMNNPITDKEIENKSREATKNAITLTKLYIQIFEDPVVRNNVKKLAIALNDSALRPFLLAALITLDDMGPAIDEASDKFHNKIRKGLRKLGDAVVGAAEDVIGTTPYIGNVWNATSGIANALQGVQATVDTSSQLILETTYRILQVMKKVNVPGIDAINSFVDFGIMAKNILKTVTNKVDAANATIGDIPHVPDPMVTTKSLANDLQEESNKVKEQYEEKMDGNNESNTDNQQNNQQNIPENKKNNTNNKKARQKGGTRKKYYKKSIRKTKKR